jgi:hypothetical protein
MKGNPVFVSNMKPLAANQRIIQKFIKVSDQIQKGEEITNLLTKEFTQFLKTSL